MAGIGDAIRTAVLAVLLAVPSTASSLPAPAYDQMPSAFASVKGERAIVMGYPEGLEVWAYPLQLISAYRIAFRVPGQVAAIAAAPLLQRVERTATETVRVYVGGDFVVRERLFVPADLPGAIVRYEVEGRPNVTIEVMFNPSLDLMWPGALGGQSIAWDAARSGYVEREPLHGFNATIASAEIVEHDAPVNRTRANSGPTRFVLAPRAAAGARIATVYVGSDDRDTPAERGVVATMKAAEPQLRQAASDRAARVLANSIELTTPDPAVNRAFASAVLALDQAWVCNVAIGCGMVAGYGPSRPGRRPQYAWFFAGDGLVAMQAMLDTGQYRRARDELDFIFRYQNRTNGMIWHEISQSAPLLDWRNKYPYMFVHVDITFQFLTGVDSYVRTTGDIDFTRKHWMSLVAAYRYCVSVIDASGLPRIPPGKQGQNEQDVMRDDIRLSTAWIDAAAGFARLARATGHDGLAADADRRAALARAAVARDGWDTARGFWLSGHTLDGTPIHGARPDAIGVLDQKVFPQARADLILDRIASPEFVTDWGVRSLSAAAPDYDPNLYGSGSVWALGTSSVATTFWRQHRPETAWGIWHGLVAWNTLDSAGHLHEVLAGDLFHPEVESVPEQTWSSAGFISSAVTGLLGLELHKEHDIRFAPHLPPQWRHVAVCNLRAGAATLDLAIDRDARGIVLTVVNHGDPVSIEFAPMIAQGATVIGASIDGNTARHGTERHDHDQHAELRFDARHGTSVARIDIAGGVEVAAVELPLMPGVVSREPKIVDVSVADRTMTLDLWVNAARRSAVDLFTTLIPRTADGARIDQGDAGSNRLIFDPSAEGTVGDFVRRRVTVKFDFSAPATEAGSAAANIPASTPPRPFANR